MALDDNIILRELTEGDASAYLNYMSNSKMLPYLTDANRPDSAEEAKKEMRYWGNLFRNKQSFYWGIALREDNKLIGTAGFNTINSHHLRAEISYDLDPNYWGKGIMLKSVKNILKFADASLNLVRVQATVIVDNDASIKLLERCGFEKEGLLKKYEIVGNEYKDYYMYART
jgi:[ribosomal protein S5]-alanine N-acetyltransferase